MNQRATATDTATLRWRDIALAGLGALLQGGQAAQEPQARYLLEAFEHAGGDQWAAPAAQALALPAPADAALARAAARLELSTVEVLAVALAAAVEDDAVVGRVLAWMQSPTAAARPALGLLARAFAPFSAAPDPLQGEIDALYQLAFGPAARAGLLLIDDERAVLCERCVRVAAPVAAALAGVGADWPGESSFEAPPHAVRSVIDAVPAMRQAIDAWAASLAGTPRATLAIRSASEAEARAVAAAIAERLGSRPAWFGAELSPGADAWLALAGRVPVFALRAAPGEIMSVPPLRCYDGPVLVTCALDGGIRRDDAAVADWRVPAPELEVRVALWQAALGDAAAAEAAVAACRYRAGFTQIAEHARLARLLATSESVGDADRSEPLQPQCATRTSLQAIARAAMMTSAGRALDALAQPLPEAVGDDALVVDHGVRAELERAVQRCAQRERLHARLGAAARTRACDGVRLLFTGVSGAGKSLAAQWLAARLGLPIYRVDLSAMLSKWIGETEKNLAELLGRAEHADVVLLFDEADTLFGKRTEIATANDRFANAQTNYLLQRIESHAGIVVLTSNSRSRFDPAFVRRLDFIIDFGAPDAQERRALWQAHLGDASTCDNAELNRLAALADFAGGNIRNAVLAAAARAQARQGAISFDDIAEGVRGEYRKLGRAVPAGL